MGCATSSLFVRRPASLFELRRGSLRYVRLAGPKLAKQAKAGAARGIRTPDPIITNDVLYQLSYCGALSAPSAWACFWTAALSMPVYPVLAIRRAVRAGLRTRVKDGLRMGEGLNLWGS